MAASETTTPSFGLRHRLSLALEVAGLKVPDMARELGVHENTVRNYLKGKHISRPALIAWASICKVDLEWLEQGISRTGWFAATAA